ncbi:hypothetical protein U1Q18_051926, partial [Sarracenia purpurea var. burkii]
MTAIDEGIKQAQMKLEAKNPRSYNDLIILTTVTVHKEVDTTLRTMFNLLLFQGNVWHKFIYQLNKQSAVLIMIHNTPEHPPSTGCLVGEQRACNFQMWSKDGKISTRILSEGLAKYAYCCEVTADDMMWIFPDDTEISKYLEIGEYLEIDSLITE